MSDTKKTMIRPLFWCRCVRIVCSLLLHRLRPILLSETPPTRLVPISFAR